MQCHLEKADEKMKHNVLKKHHDFPEHLSKANTRSSEIYGLRHFFFINYSGKILLHFKPHYHWQRWGFLWGESDKFTSPTSFSWAMQRHP